jgi:HNH endonuclease/AP2 domain
MTLAELIGWAAKSPAGTRAVPLTFRRDSRIVGYAFVDEADWPRVSEHIWRFDGRYPATEIGGKNVRLHRFLMGDPAEPGVEVDHRNRDRMDNRRVNLRWVTRPGNAANTSARGGSSRFRGVVWDTRRGHWRAQAETRGKGYHLGYFDSEEAAAEAVRVFWLEHGQDVNNHLDRPCMVGAVWVLAW